MISPHILPWNSAFLDPQTSKVINEDFLNKLIWILFFFGLVVEPTHLKNMVVKLEIFPRFRAENLKIFEKAPPSSFGMHKFWGYNLGGPSRPPKYLLFCRKIWLGSIPGFFTISDVGTARWHKKKQRAWKNTTIQKTSPKPKNILCKKKQKKTGSTWKRFGSDQQKLPSKTTSGHPHVLTLPWPFSHPRIGSGFRTVALRENPATVPAALKLGKSYKNYTKLGCFIHAVFGV